MDKYPSYDIRENTPLGVLSRYWLGFDGYFRIYNSHSTLEEEKILGGFRYG